MSKNTISKILLLLYQNLQANTVLMVKQRHSMKIGVLQFQLQLPIKDKALLKDNLQVILK
jgi:hypothetical protein